MASQVFPMQGNPRQIFVPYNAKIADITHADTNKHTLTLANAGGTGAITGETRKIIALLWTTSRIAGTGYVYSYSNEGANMQQGPTWIGSYDVTTIIANGTQRLQYSLTVANDDFDMYCYGYVVEA
jgi:hypothetical protein